MAYEPLIDVSIVPRTQDYLWLDAPTEHSTTVLPDSAP